MAPKPKRYFRARSLRLLKEMYPDNPDYVRERMTDFDRRNGIDKAKPRRPKRIKAKPGGRYAALTRPCRRGERLPSALSRNGPQRPSKGESVHRPTLRGLLPLSGVMKAVPPSTFTTRKVCMGFNSTRNLNASA